MVNDMQFISRNFGKLNPEIFDLQQVVRRMGFKKLGLDAVVKEIFGVEVDKSLQDSGWDKRPLSDEEIFYCLEDVRWVRKIFDKVRDQVVAQDWELTSKCYAEHSDKGHKWETSGWKLGLEATSELRTLVRFFWMWREKVAERENLNVGEFMTKAVLIGLARKCYEKWYEMHDHTYIPTYGRWGFISSWDDFSAFLKMHPKFSWMARDWHE